MPTEHQFSVQKLINMTSLDGRNLTESHLAYGNQYAVVLELCQIFTILYLAEADRISGNQRELKQLLSNVAGWLLEVGLIQNDQTWDDLFEVLPSEKGETQIILREDCLTINTSVDPFTGEEKNNRAAIVKSLTKCHVPVLVARKHLVE